MLIRNSLRSAQWRDRGWLSSHLRKGSRMGYAQTTVPRSSRAVDERDPSIWNAELETLHTRYTVTLERLMRFGSSDFGLRSVLESGELTRKELIERLERRVNVQLSLPYLPASNPHTSEVMSIYTKALDEMRGVLPITDGESNDDFVRRLEKMIDEESNVIQLFAKGFAQSSRYLSQEEITRFLERAIRSRLSIRLLAENHIALSANPPSSKKIGIVDRELDVSQSIDRSARFVKDLCDETYGVSPEWTIDGMVDAKACFVGIHLEYILIEVLKNSFRATVESELKKHHHLSPGHSLKPIEITITIDGRTGPESEDLGNRHRKSLAIRVRDFGGGIDPQNMDKIFSYAFTSVGSHGGTGSSINEDQGRVGAHDDGLRTGLGRIAGLGYGLPMARLYCRYFGGNLEVFNMFGLSGGVDCVLVVSSGPDVI